MSIVAPPLKIVNYPHPALRHKAAPLTSLSGSVRRIAEAMTELMIEHKGLGLAAPQVGLPFRLFIARIPYRSGDPDEVNAFINPVIQERHGSVEAEEGCLSFPGLYRKVRRARSVVAQAYDLDGQLIELKLNDLPARVWQHESDHLDGVLFIDKVGVIARMTLRSPLAEFERDYKKAQTRGEIPPDAQIEQQLARLEETGPPDLTPPPQAL